jgi:hypothetical protein
MGGISAVWSAAECMKWTRSCGQMEALISGQADQQKEQLQI